MSANKFAAHDAPLPMALNDNVAGCRMPAVFSSGNANAGMSDWRVISILSSFCQIGEAETRRRLIELLASMEG